MENMKFKQLIVHEGVPYALTRYNHDGGYDPCYVCDLKKVCFRGEVTLSLLPLCQPEGADQGWFFEENWDLIDRGVAEFV